MTTDEIIAVAVDALRRIAPETEPADLDRDTDYRRALDIDSFDALRFIVAISQALQVEIPEQDYGQITTLHSLAEYVQTSHARNRSGITHPGHYPG